MIYNLPIVILQEILLQRSSNIEKLGLTLCYETEADDGVTEIFIDDIHPEGLAARERRLQLGDQIIQVVFLFLNIELMFP